MHSSRIPTAVELVLLLSLLVSDVIGRAQTDGPPFEAAGRVLATNSFLATLSEQERAWLRDHPVIRVICDHGWPPVEFTDEHGRISGMSGDYLKLVEQRLGLKFMQVESTNWPEAYDRLKRWDIDMTTSVAVTPPRKEFWAFTKPYLKIPIVIATQLDVTYIADIQELAGKKVGVVQGYAMDDWLSQQHPEIKLVRVDSAFKGLELLQRGEVFAYIDNLLIIGYYQSRMMASTIKIAGQTPYMNSQCMAVRKDWAPLAGILDKALESISEKEKNAIYRNWLPVRYEHEFNYTALWRVMAVFTAILLILAFWNRKLAREINSRTRAEDELRRSEAKFRAVVETVPLAIHVSVGKEQKYEYLNPASLKLFGYTLEEIPTIAQWWPLAYPDEAYRRRILEEWTNRVQRAINTGSPIDPMETIVVCKDGSKKNIAWGYINVGEINYACGLDMTALKKAEESLRKSLEEKESMLKEIHHRVKNNMQVISSLLRLQSATIDNPAAKAALLDMQNRVRSMAIVHEHLYKSDNLAQVDLSSYLKNLCQQLLRVMAPRGGAVRLCLDIVPARLEMDKAVPCGLLVNELVSNAFKHAFPDGRGGEVRVQLHPVDGESQIRLRVADNGVGLPPGFDSRRLSSLGLQLAFDLARQIGGRLEIGAGPGAQFEVTFKTSQ